ncbi:NHL repeat containing protein [Alcanivorax sp. 521-1]|uniref:NHL repeat containing protein n=1 Tax=Alloalcanivorax profundimaris TaxID=2735259 RepID=A0ABS0ATL1_9GAMM|nr:NHL repeat-containing protein [Alloalcanivorax profundimaris]MBF5057455.1 NHL repeat containing protein [Alloalcanivorax profundimaris]
MKTKNLAGALLLGALPLTIPLTAGAFDTFADEDRSAELSGEPVQQRYQFNTPTTVTYDRDSLSGGASGARVYVADMGNHEIKVLNLNGALVGRLDDADTTLAGDSPAASVPEIRAPLGIAFLSESEADDDRLAGLYVNDVGRQQIHFFRTVAGAAGDFEYVTSIGQPGHGGGEDLYLPRNMTITPQGFIYVSDEFNHRVKAFSIDPDNGYQVSLIQTLGHQESGDYVQAGPIIRGVDKNYGSDSTHYDDYAGEPAKRDGYRIPQGMTYYQSPDNGATYLYVADNGNNRIKIFRVDTGTGQLTLDDMLGRFRDDDGDVDHLKRPRGVRTDLDGDLYVADTYNGRILRFDNLAATTDSDPIRYRANQSSDAEAAWVYGRLGIHQVEMRAPTSAGTEDEAFQLPNDLVPVIRADGSFYRENIYSWGYYYSNARVHLVSDSGNNRIKKCWTNSSGTSLLRCSVSAGVGTVSDNEYWGHPRTLPGQLHSASGMAWLGSKNRLLVSDTPNTRINMYDSSGNYQGRFPGTNISYGVTGIATFNDPNIGEGVAVLVGADATLPWPYTGDASLRIYDADGNLEELFNLSYRTGGLSAPEIGLSTSNTNYPVSVSVHGEGGDEHAVYITSFGNYVWRFDYDSGSGTLDGNWYAGGPDSAKGNDLGENWSLGPDFFEQGAAGTFDQIGDVLALDDRVYVTDRRNQRLQALDPATGARLGQVGLGGGTYDHPDGLDPDRLFLPAGLAYDAGHDALIVADGFNMVARVWNNPDDYAPNASGVIDPAYQGHWLDRDLGTRPGGLFDTEQVAVGGGNVYVFSLISNRITRFSWSELNP